MAYDKIKLLYTDIGRGHPFYLDGIVEELNRNGGIDSVHSKSSVFDHSTGLSLQAWQLVRRLYISGGKDSVVSKFYKKLRQNNNYNKDSITLKILGNGIQKRFLYDLSPLIVAHPILVSILKKRKNLFYQHGEVIAPDESIVTGADKIFVPLISVKEKFLKYYDKDDIIVTGLCIEPSITRIAVDAFKSRIERFDLQKSLTGCFISSGAEPIAHVEVICNALLSHIREKGKAILFVKKDGFLEKSIEKLIKENTLNFAIFDSLEGIPYDLPELTIMQYSNRRDENRFTTHFFRYFDFLVSPSHERTNWAIGLGLPQFITEPAIGPFSPLNRQFLLDAQVAVSLDNRKDSKQFAFILKDLHISGRLKQMSYNGWGKYPIDGFKQIVSYLKNNS